VAGRAVTRTSLGMGWRPSATLDEVGGVSRALSAPAPSYSRAARPGGFSAVDAAAGSAGAGREPGGGGARPISAGDALAGGRADEDLVYLANIASAFTWTGVMPGRGRVALCGEVLVVGDAGVSGLYHLDEYPPGVPGVVPLRDGRSTDEIRRCGPLIRSACGFRLEVWHA
jgi:hypothetical protein